MLVSFQDILNRTRGKQPLPWYKTLQQYYRRPQWELFDLRTDPAETNNLHGPYHTRAACREGRWRCLPSPDAAE